MQLSEMIRRLRVSLNDEEEPYKYSTNRITLWLNGAYMDRQLSSSYWKFMHQRGSFIVTQVGESDYYPAQIQTIDPESIYYLEPGASVNLPLELSSYHEWMEQQANGVVLAPSNPLYLIEMPDFGWKVYPTPDRVYRIYADRWYKPSEFATVSSEPLWESEFHEIVVLDAMKIAAALRPDSPESSVMIQQVRERLPRLERLFNARYLPAIGSPGAHL